MSASSPSPESPRSSFASSVSTSVQHIWHSLEAARRRLEHADAATLHSQITLAEIPAPTGSEKLRAVHLDSAFRRMGLATDIDSAGNVVAQRAGVSDDAPVVVCAHMDTVFDASTPVQVQRELRSERLVGPGIGDNARGLAGMLAIAGALQLAQLRTRRPILFAATTGEEGGGDLRGARHLFAQRASDAVAAIALDGAGDQRIVTHALGIRRFRIRISGPGGHSWASYGVANALHAAAAVAAELASWRLPHSPRSALTVSRMGGGTAINAIPSDAWLEIDVRSSSSFELDRLEREIRHAARASVEGENVRRRASSPPLQLAVDIIGDRPAGVAPADAFVVGAAFDATRLINRNPEEAIASTDANIPLSLGIPAVALGAGGAGGDTHTVREWFENRQGSVGLARAMTVMVAAAGLA